MSILIPANRFVCIKTPIQYLQNILWVPGYLQIIWKEVVSHLLLTAEFVGHKTHYTTHKNICGTWVTQNDRTQPAAGVCGRGVAR